jgi:hypothetical protein
MFWIPSFKKHQFLIADVRQSMFLFSMDLAMLAEEGFVPGHTARLGDGQQAAAAMILQWWFRPGPTNHVPDLPPSRRKAGDLPCGHVAWNRDSEPFGGQIAGRTFSGSGVKKGIILPVRVFVVRSHGSPTPVVPPHLQPARNAGKP